LVDLAEHFFFLFDNLFKSAVGVKYRQHAHVFVELAFVFGGELVQTFQDVVYDFSFWTSLKVTKDGQHQGVWVVLAEQGLAVHRVHVDDAVAVVQSGLLKGIGHAERGFTDVDQVLANVSP